MSAILSSRNLKKAHIRSVLNPLFLVCLGLGGPVLFVADFFHPVGGLAVEPFLNGDVRHCRGCLRPVPMLLAGLDRDHITWSNLLDRVSPALYQAAASCHDQGLAQRVGMPSRPSAWLKGNTGPNCTCRIGCFKQWVNLYGARKILGRSFTGKL